MKKHYIVIIAFLMWVFNGIIFATPVYAQSWQAGTVYNSGHYGSGWIWNDLASTAPNGVPMIFSATIIVPTSGSVSFSMAADDWGTVSIDNTPMWLISIPNTLSESDSLTAGEHTITVFAENTMGQNPVTNSPSNAAGLYVVVTQSGQTLATTAQPSEWSVQQWGSGYGEFNPYPYGGTSQTNIGPINMSATMYANSGIPLGSGIYSGSIPTGLTITPSSQTIQIGSTQAYTITENLGNGSSQDITSSATLTSSNPNIASLSAATATGVATGTVTITASYDNMIATATLTVNSAATPPVPPNPPSPPVFNTYGDYFHQLIDTALGPVSNFLQYAIAKMNTVSQIAAQGLNLDNFLGPIAYLGSAWIAMVTSLLAALLLIIIVFIARQVYNLYLALKSGVKWW